MPENRLLIKIYSQVCGQITDNGDLNISAVKTVLDLYRIPNQLEMLNQLLECNRKCRAIQKLNEKKGMK